jgi:serine protease AprX
MGLSRARVLRRTLGCGVSLAVGLFGLAAGAPIAAGGQVASQPQQVIVTAAPGDIAQAKHAVVALGGHVGPDLWIINGFVAQVRQGDIAVLRQDPALLGVEADAVTTVQGSSYTPATDPGSPAGLGTEVGASTYWNAGFTGDGIGVALIDSGVSPVAALAAEGKVFYGPDFTPIGYFSQARGLDEYGHGTFMAGIIAGRQPGAGEPTASAAAGYYLGVAPDAHIVSVKVADQAGATVQSAVIAGIQWTVQHRNDPGLNIRVLNLSLGARTGLPYASDPLAAAAEAAWKAGLVVVAATGNDGRSGVLSPATDPYVIAVGALDGGSTPSPYDDQVALFSNRGNGIRNPDFATIGTHVVGLRVPGSAIDQAYGSGPGSVNADLVRGSGTSESTAIASGAAALLLSQRPNLTPDEVKATLAVHSMWLRGLTPFNAGGGELNLGWTFNAATEHRVQTWAPAMPVADMVPVSAGNAATEPADAPWAGAVWTGAVWTGAVWTGAVWTGAVWSGATWTGALWTGAVWSGAVW